MSLNTIVLPYTREVVTSPHILETVFAQEMRRFSTCRSHDRKYTLGATSSSNTGSDWIRALWVEAVHPGTRDYVPKIIGARGYQI
ncbi:hypothetical protein AC579_4370 [Pseudocercospora musae]|uniref:Uncharacterized protein n=1 Tax=Pseudocercospora musae TaxID=113226 RepID=A0A139IQJ7_9PEZI|nr:hypothetical protein AC579_4370 [Pseudocercospora musae]